MDEKILFVDDDPNILEIYQRALRKTFRIDIATSGEEGLRLLAERGPYAVVVADMGMPIMNGIDFLGRVRELSPDTVRMVLTGRESTATAAVNQANVFRFLVKPCPVDTVLSALVAGVNEYRHTVTQNERIELDRIHPREAAPWNMSLGPEILTLHHSDGRSIIMLFREEAARYMHFNYDPIRGTMVTVSFTPGMKGYSFLLSSASLARLLAWLPHKAPEETRKEIRRSGTGVGLLGIAQLLLTQGASWGWGLLLLLTALAGVIAPRRQMYFVNSVLLLLVGLADLVLYSPAGPNMPGIDITALMPVLMGGLLIICFAHQVSLTSPNHQLRAARAIRDRQAEFLPSHSPMVHGVGQAFRWVSLAFAAYAAAVLVVAYSYANALGTLGGLTSMLPDLAIFGVLAVLLFVVSAEMAMSKRPAYLEAKVAGQLVISVGVLSFWSVLLNFDIHAPLSFFGRVFSPDILLFDHPYAWGSMSFFGGWMSKELAVYARPYVWITLVACVVAFNWWFTGSVDKELEDQRCQRIP
jgi:ActR/RegA family two-component response regulator